MKPFTFTMLLAVLFPICGCKDISEVGPEAENAKSDSPATAGSDKESPPKPTSLYPIERTISDSEGRQIDVQILAKSNGEIGVMKTSSNKAFILPLTRLSEADQTWLNGKQDGGDLESIRAMIERNAKLAGRVAVWHPQFYNAESEAKKLDVPLLTAFIFNNDPASESVESRVLYSKEFRTWANQNAALCLIRLDRTDSGRVSSISSGDNREISSRFGVMNDIAYILTLPGQEPLELPENTFGSGDELIAAVSKVISDPSVGIAVEAIPVPERTKPQGKGKGGGKGGK